MKEVSNNKGFTLIELLATIAVLSVVITIVIYSATNVLDVAKNKSYLVTINNIESSTNSYVSEKVGGSNWVLGSSINGYNEYQCVSVQNLIDAGYFKNDVLNSYVSDNRKVLVTDYIYLERDPDTKSILENSLLLDETMHRGFCGFDMDGAISIVASPIGWSQEKTINIQYNIYNMKNADDLKKYKYEYRYKNIDGDIDLNGSGNFSSVKHVEEKIINKNGVMEANIIITMPDLTEKIVSHSLLISKIDNEKPVGEITSTNDVANKQRVRLTMNDSLSLVSEYYFGLKDPVDSVIEWEKVDNVDNETETIFTEVSDSGIYYFAVKDNAGNISDVVTKAFYKTELVLDNASVSENTIITMEGNSFVLPSVTVDTNYTFKGWYRDVGYNEGLGESYTPTSDSTLYGNVIPKIVVAVPTCNTSLIYDGTYQQLVNEGEGYTVTNGSKINAGNYSVTVTLSDNNNYRWDDMNIDSIPISCSIAKKNLTVTANSQTVNYKSSIVSGNDKVTVSGLVSGDSINSVNLTANPSDITSNGTITPGNITIKRSDTDVTSNYNITYVANTLTVNRYKVIIKYSVNGGSIQASAGGHTWSSDTNGIIRKNGSVYIETYDYDSKLISSGLSNWNNSNWINVTRTDYVATSGAEWKCLNGDCEGSVFNHSSDYDTSDFCDASESDCTVTVGVNWRDSVAPQINKDKLFCNNDKTYKNELWFNVYDSGGYNNLTTRYYHCYTEHDGGCPTISKFVDVPYSTKMSGSSDSSSKKTKYTANFGYSWRALSGELRFYVKSCDPAGNCSCKKFIMDWTSSCGGYSVNDENLSCS